MKLEKVNKTQQQIERKILNNDGHIKPITASLIGLITTIAIFNILKNKTLRTAFIKLSVWIIKDAFFNKTKEVRIKK